MATQKEKQKYTAGPFELDHATDDGTRHFIVHGELPEGLNASYGYPICDSLNRHHCVSPEEDEANGHLFAASWDMLEALKGIWELLTPGQQGCARIKAEAQTPVVIPYWKLAKISEAIDKATHRG